MNARRTPPRMASNDSAESAPRLGTVIRFEPAAASAGVRSLAETGFRVASSSDFKLASAVPNDLGGADVQYFERFGIAIVRETSGRLDSYLSKTVQAHMVQNARPERVYRSMRLLDHDAVESAADPFDGAATLRYIRGYRDGVNELAERILEERNGLEPSVSRRASSNESTMTWGLRAIGADVSRFSGRGIKVAVLDTGVDDSHPDFRGRAITRKCFVTNNSADDIIGHGTHCIGTACGPKAPASGPRYGVAYGAEIFAGKVLGDDGYGTDRSIISGMDWALENGCEVISLSLGGAVEIGDEPTEDFERIGRVCLDAGTIVIAAAGNESSRPHLVAPVCSPANAKSIMAVGAVDRAMLVGAFSCGGINVDQAVDIAGPGVDVLSSVPGGGYARYRGTSMATPHVAGVAALLAESDKSFRGWALWARLIQTAQPLPLPARDVGKGLVRAP